MRTEQKFLSREYYHRSFIYQDTILLSLKICKIISLSSSKTVTRRSQKPAIMDRCPFHSFLPSRYLYGCQQNQSFSPKIAILTESGNQQIPPKIIRRRLPKQLELLACRRLFQCSSKRRPHLHRRQQTTHRERLEFSIQREKYPRRCKFRQKSPRRYHCRLAPFRGYR